MKDQFRRLSRRGFLAQSTAGLALASSGPASPLNLIPGPDIEMKTRIVDSSVRFVKRSLATPLQLSSGLITEITEARASVTVEVGREIATGRGAIYLSDLWSWPRGNLDHPARDRILRALCVDYASDLFALCGGKQHHPLELGLRLHQSVGRETPSSADEPPVLARIMCASPFDAALHDAVGLALGRSSFDLYADAMNIPSADHYFLDRAVPAIRHVIRKPVSRLKAWWVVGAHDSIEKDVLPAIQKRGFHCFKMKLLGKDNDADIARTVEVYRGVREAGVTNPRISLDSNEANPDSESVLDYLLKLREADQEAFASVEYLEQPTSRDIMRNRFDWHQVARIKPVFLDEGLTGPELFQEAVSQGWSGFAIKTCKGHSFAMIAAAWAAANGLKITIQDLTNPGYAAIHAALLAAHLPSLNGVELNSPQFTPDANQEWLPRLSRLFQPRNGYHELPSTIPPGLGSQL